MNDLIEAVHSYVVSFLSANLPQELLFHNINHTYEVVEAVKEIGSKCGLSEEEKCIAEAAAWFHDCGYASTYIGHENESIKLAKNFLENFGCKKEFIDAVLSCIESTKYPSKPSTAAEKVVCDANLQHLAKTNYSTYEKALRKEFEIFLKLSYDDSEWIEINRSFMSSHQYHTDYGQKVLAKLKLNNIQINCP